jgi:hypothetical protein
MPKGSTLTPHRRWALDALVEAIKSDSYGVADVIHKPTGKVMHMVGKLGPDKGDTVQFIPVALLMDSRILEDYTHEVDLPLIVSPYA